MNAAAVLELVRACERANIAVWLMGGWGIDALLGRQTREHHDLDLLVEAGDLERFRLLLVDAGYAFRYVWWEEVRWVRDEAWASPVEEPTAFVYGAEDGREVDVHVVRTSGGAAEMLWTAPYELTEDALEATGEIDGRRVRCLSRAMQRRAHTGYELPPHHQRDLELLEALV